MEEAVVVEMEVKVQMDKMEMMQLDILVELLAAQEAAEEMVETVHLEETEEKVDLFRS